VSQQNDCFAVMMDTSFQPVMIMHVEVFKILEFYAAPIGNKLPINIA